MSVGEDPNEYHQYQKIFFVTFHKKNSFIENQLFLKLHKLMKQIQIRIEILHLILAGIAGLRYLENGLFIEKRLVMSFVYFLQIC